MHVLSSAEDPVRRYRMYVPRHARRDILFVPTSPIQDVYLKMMRRVDTSDQLRVSYSTQIFIKECWQRLFFNCYDQTISNSYIMQKTTLLEAPHQASDSPADYSGTGALADGISCAAGVGQILGCEEGALG